MRTMLAVMLIAGAAQARPRRVESGPSRTSLLELYTSEGCSSCPPADELVNGVADRFPGRLLPLAFHVDYWDELGWPDRFASPRWTARQRARSARIYTPELMVNGRELTDRKLELPSAPPRASLVLELDGGRATVTATGGERVYLAVTESGFAVEVKAGENRGRTLRHDHVVRALLGPFPAGRPTTQALALDPSWKIANLALTAFVEDGGGEVLQAVRLPVGE